MSLRLIAGRMMVVAGLVWCPWVHAKALCKAPDQVYVKGVEGCSFYKYFRDQKWLPPDLPDQLKIDVGDDPERRWGAAVFGLTLFTESRNENDHSIAAAAAVTLNRAGFGKAGFSIDRLPDASVNAGLSQWLRAYQHERGHHPEGPGEHASTEAVDAERQIVEDPLAYVRAPHRGNPPFAARMARSTSLAQCIYRRLETSVDDPALAWVHSFGTMFITPLRTTPVSTASVPTKPCTDHKGYLGKPGLEYCAVSQHPGECASEQDKDPAACGDGASPIQHYELSKPLNKEGLRTLDQQIETFLQSCPYSK